MGDKCLPTLVVGDEDKFHRSFRRGEDMCGLVGLFMCGNKLHVPRRDPNEGRHVVVAASCGAEFHGVSSQTRRIKTTRKGVFGDSEEASAWRAALNISSGSYSGLAIHEPV